MVVTSHGRRAIVPLMPTPMPRHTSPPPTSVSLNSKCPQVVIALCGHLPEFSCPRPPAPRLKHLSRCDNDVSPCTRVPGQSQMTCKGTSGQALKARDAGVLRGACWWWFPPCHCSPVQLNCAPSENSGAAQNSTWWLPQNAPKTRKDRQEKGDH